ncbi:MAG TPA: isoprenylcysteine carboxylmethyltransferase family protein [Methanocella sp.]|nr:isoprenylcysteine carboxylmethyltransferase family protein [Methanocella sp.]
MTKLENSTKICNQGNGDSRGVKIMPPTYFIVLLALSIGAHLVFPVKMIISAPFSYAGILFIAAGIVLNLWSSALFSRKKTTIYPFGRPGSLLVAGPYRISRNPIYLGMFAALLGAAILLGSLTPFVFPVAFLAIIGTRFIPVEERNLEAEFGDDYRNYRRVVRRWI